MELNFVCAARSPIPCLPTERLAWKVQPPGPLHHKQPCSRPGSEVPCWVQAAGVREWHRAWPLSLRPGAALGPGRGRGAGGRLCPRGARVLACVVEPVVDSPPAAAGSTPSPRHPAFQKVAEETVHRRRDNRREVFAD